MYIYIHIHTCVYTHTDIHCIYIQGSGNSAKGSRGKGGLFFLRFFFEIFFFEKVLETVRKAAGAKEAFWLSHMRRGEPSVRKVGIVADGYFLYMYYR